MKMIVGLGNPGPKYERTRHNVGFLAIDEMVSRWRAQGPTSREQGAVFQAEVGGEKVLLVKPMTYMNLSGRCVGPLFHFHKLNPTDLIVIHDELDLPPSSIRLKTGGGTGGHNGLKSIDEALGSGKNGYHRIRLGIGHPTALQLPIAPVDWVLQSFSASESRGLEEMLGFAVDAAELLVADKATQAMNSFNKKTPNAAAIKKG